MNNNDELFTELLQKYASGTKAFDELLFDLKILSGEKLVKNLNNYFERRIKDIINRSLLNETGELAAWQVLENIQEMLCKFLYKENIKLSQTLKDFVYDFDRIDDPQMRGDILKRLKNKELSYA